MLIKARQIRAARALIGLTQREMATLLRVSEPTLKRIESDDWGPARSAAGTIAAIQGLLEERGVRFLPPGPEGGEGVRLVEPGPPDGSRDRGRSTD